VLGAISPTAEVSLHLSPPPQGPSDCPMNLKAEIHRAAPAALEVGGGRMRVLPFKALLSDESDFCVAPQNPVPPPPRLPASGHRSPA
jgi:hypothetical protein